MTLIGYDLFDYLCNTLRAGGFSRVKQLSNRLKQKADVYGHNGVLAVVHGPYKITAKPQNDLFGEQSLSPYNIQTEFDGKPIYRVSLNGNTIKAGTYPTSTSTVQCRCDDWRKNCPDRNVVVDAGVHVIRTGDIVQFYGEEVYPCGKHGAYAKWHSITFTPVN